MISFCTSCWMEMTSDADRCPRCGAVPQNDARSYDEKIQAAMRHPLPQTRARVCWVIGQRHALNAVQLLTEMLNDSDLFVRVEAIRALEQTGDPLAAPVLARESGGDTLLAKTARECLHNLRMKIADAPSHSRNQTKRHSAQASRKSRKRAK